MNDPLSLNAVPTPPAVRAEQISPQTQIANLYRRMTGPNADSPEAKLTLLTHLVYHTYLDLKDACKK